MKIAMVSLTAEPRPGDGPPSSHHATYTAWLARAIGARGHDVTVFARPDVPTRRRSRDLGDGAAVEYLSGGPPGSRDETTLVGHVAGLADDLGRRFRQHRPDVVHALSWASGLAALVAARPARIPVVTTFYELGTSPAPRPVPAQVRPSDRLRLERAVAHDADVVVSPCTDQADTLARLGLPRTKVRVVPSGIDTEWFAPDGPAQPRDDAARIVCLDGIGGDSGADGLVHAVAHLPGVRLCLTGGPPPEEIPQDPDAQRLRALARRLGMDDRLDLTGRLPLAATPALLRSADIVATVRPYDPLGLATLQAMACGVPVVAADGGGPADMVVDGATGALVPPGRPEALLVALRRLLDDPVRREGYGVAAADRTRVRYPWHRIAPDVEEAYRAATEGERSVTGGFAHKHPL